MIQPLRALHRGIFFSLAVVLPAVLVAGLSTRHRVLEPPRQIDLALSNPPGTLLILEKTESVDHHRLQLRLLRDAAKTRDFYVQFVLDSPWVVPDVLVYSSANPGTDGLPDHAQLLGPFQPKEIYRLSAPAGNGYALLYSLAQQKILAAIPLGGSS